MRHSAAEPESGRARDLYIVWLVRHLRLEFLGRWRGSSSPRFFKMFNNDHKRRSNFHKPAVKCATSSGRAVDLAQLAWRPNLGEPLSKTNSEIPGGCGA